MGIFCCCLKFLKKTEQSGMQRNEFSKIPSSGKSTEIIGTIANSASVASPSKERDIIRELKFVSTEVEATYFEETWQDAEDSSQLWSTKLDSVPQTNVLIQRLIP